MNVVEIALTARLEGGTALTTLLGEGTASVFNGIAPAGAAYPFVSFQQMSGGDDNDNPHRARQMVYQVEAVTDTNMEDASTIDEVIDALLHQQPLTVPGWSNFWLVREADLKQPELAGDDVRYYHAGGLYRVRIAR